MNHQIFKQNLADHRTLSGKTRAQQAKLFGICPRVLCKWEHEKIPKRIVVMGALAIIEEDNAKRRAGK